MRGKQTGILVVLAMSIAMAAAGARAQAQDMEPATSTAPPQAMDPTATAPGGDQAATAADDDIVDLDTMVVSGAQPGPGMWKVRRGDHVLHILGTVSPLPRRMEWSSGKVEAVIAGSQAVIGAPSIEVDADVGLFRGMALLPAMLRARNNPGKRPLSEVVSPPEYARWQVLKARYMGRDRGVEKRRPLLAAQALYEAALDKSGLRTGGIVAPVVRRARKAGDVPLVETTVRLTVQDPKAVLKELNESDLADRECFAGTMDRIETDLDNMRARANAWAVGDIDGLRALPYENHYVSCQEALTGSALAQRLGVADLPRRAGEAWLDNVDRALAEHDSSFAMLPMHYLLKADGMLEKLAARGYVIEAP
ncbi:TraB/GumN family protein [Luteimonas sp. MJ246]|uniref:TraB/GumN family protein n=1 Tax=Luteimonas sp. MJ174 TaxID=3129237 RepID=UPI0031B9F136